VKRVGWLGSPAVRGVTLVELMVTLVIGSVVIVGALALYARGSDLYRVSERVARLQEQARVAMSVIEPDIELAGYYGFTNSPDAIQLTRGANPGGVLALAHEMRQWPLRMGGAVPVAVAGLPAGAHSCGINFAVDVTTPVQASNGVFALGVAPTGCEPYQGRARPGADTLTLRRAETQRATAEANRLQLFTSRLSSQAMQLLIADGVSPGAVDADHELRNLVVRTYYVARDSVGRRDFPALRVKALTRSGNALAFADDEVMPGVEDLQVQLAITAGADPHSEVQYVNPDAAEVPYALVVGVRIWLRLRADEAEPSFSDALTYRYADIVYAPAGAERHFRRVLVSRTVAVRNARSS